MSPRTVSEPRPTGPFDAVLFDLFGTLIPTGSQAARVRSLEAMARALDVDPGRFAGRWLASFDERARGAMGTLEQTIDRLARALGGRPARDAVERAGAIRTEFSRSLLDGGGSSLAALDRLRAAGLRLGLVSDTTDDTVRAWPTSALAARFDAVVFSCVEGLRKPDPRIFRLALRRLRRPASRCAFVGDGGSHELSGAEAVGLTAFRYVFPEDPVTAYRIDAETTWKGVRLEDLGELLGPWPRGSKPRESGGPSGAGSTGGTLTGGLRRAGDGVEGRPRG
jgi:putative hydrolase of the HAD superfamily